MDPVLFSATIDAMDRVLSAIDTYYKYAKLQTELGSTSSYVLVQESLRTFHKDIFLKDYETIYG